MENDTRYNSVHVIFGDAVISIIRITSGQILRDGADLRCESIRHDLYNETKSHYFGNRCR